jgi:hypothetical protein
MKTGVPLKNYLRKNNRNCPTAQKNTSTYLIYFENQTLILMNFTKIFRHITYSEMEDRKAS